MSDKRVAAIELLKLGGNGAPSEEDYDTLFE